MSDKRGELQDSLLLEILAGAVEAGHVTKEELAEIRGICVPRSRPETVWE